ATEAPAAAERSVTIENCGQQVTYTKIPERAVSNDVNITEIMLALGLQDQMAGMSGVGSRFTDRLLPEFQAQAADIPVISEKYFTLEPLLGVIPDFVYAGWGYGFSEEKGITPASLSEQGIASYVLEESCAQRGERPASTLENTLFHDIRNLGVIFDVEERAEALIAQYERELAEVQANLPVDADLPVFLYDSGEQDVFTAGGNAIPTAIISAAGGTNIFADLKKSWTTVGWEAIVERNPEFIVIVDYSEVTAEQKQAFATNLPAMKDVPAVVNQRFAVLPYAAATPGPRNIAAVRTLAKAFYPDAFGATPAAPVTGGFPLTIENCGVTQTYTAPPERAVSLNQQSTELMLALGLANRMVGTAYLDDAIFEPLAADYARVPVLAEKYPSLEVLLAADPDFVYAGYSSAFDDISQGSRALLREQGINTYIQPSSCKSEGAQADNVQRSAAGVADIYAEIRQLGQIFGVPERAEQLIASIETELNTVATALADVTAKPQIFYFAYGDDPPDTRGQFGLMTTLIDLAGGQNIFDDLAEDWTTVSWEEVISRDAEVIVIDNFGLEASKRQTYMLENPKLSSITAVRNQRFVIVPYSATIGGTRIGTTVRQLAEGFHPEAFR
ncbi:MAG: ABC transporter substrate-binding protein, partial [Oscillochloris sp.]|nr:ABC transporter substrate-binding protein [Oscillochloris sp.]